MDILSGLSRMINLTNLLFGQKFILGRLTVIIQKILMQKPFCSYGLRCMKNMREKFSTVLNYVVEN